MVWSSPLTPRWLTLRPSMRAVSFLLVSLLSATPALPQSTADFFLHGAGGTANPPTLFLDRTAPTETTAKFKDSASINFSGGNPWKEVGTWPADPALTSGTLSALSDLHAWLGLKNSDDQGTNFDLQAELYKNGALLTSGLTRCITGVTRNPDLAKEALVAFSSFPPTDFNWGHRLGSQIELGSQIGDWGQDWGHGSRLGSGLDFDNRLRLPSGPSWPGPYA